ncbi:GerAB/ArcD/ProY family transporter [Paenibacillus sp. SAF-054]|uniref:GerAB/ArcD/ProY family transporter n=1 Tax=unclassified Paenibacillus TaxID=185978 RepID=UPI003F8123BC
MKEKLNFFHIMMLIYMAEKNVTFFSLPRQVAANIGTNGWIIFILLSMVAVVNILLFWVVYRLGRGSSAFEILESVLPRFLLYPMYILLSCFWIVAAACIGKNFFLGYRMSVFPTTNPNYIYLLFCFMLFTLLIKPIYNVSKANTVFFLMTFWIMMLCFTHVKDWETVRFTTFWFTDNPEKHSFINYWEIYTSFVGFEFCVFLFPYVNKQSKLFKGVILGHCLISLSLLMLIIISFGFFSFGQLLTYSYPVVNLLDYIEFSFSNRIENMVLALFMLANLIVTYMFSFAALSTWRQMIPRMKPKRMEFMIVLMVFVIGCFPQTLLKSDELMQNVLYIESSLGVLIPLCLLAALFLKKLKVR